MSLVNEKLFDANSIKPKKINDFIEQYHIDYDGERYIRDRCPACGNKGYSFAFDKYSFHYVRCDDCMSLYVQNVIDDKEFDKYSQSIIDKIYNTPEYQTYLETLESETSFELEILFSRFLGNKTSSNIGYMGTKEIVYKNSLKKFNTDIDIFDFEQGVSKYKFDFIIVDHILEKSTNIEILIKNIYDSLSKDGTLYILSRVGSGIDILTLWEDSKVFPIEHKNLLSIDGIKKVLINKSFAIKELNTPGILDVDNILKSGSQNIPQFLTYLDKFDQKASMEEFKIFLQKNLLSSFATIVAKKD